MPIVMGTCMAGDWSGSRGAISFVGKIWLCVPYLYLTLRALLSSCIQLSLTLRVSLSLSHAARSLIFMYTTFAYAARFLISVSLCALSYLQLTLRAFLSTCIQLLITLRVSLSLSHAARFLIFISRCRPSDLHVYNSYV